MSPYRINAKPEEPVDIEVKLTAQELADAVREYVEREYNTIIPDSFINWSILASTGTDFKTRHNGNIVLVSYFEKKKK
jgi:hypothetical protein